MAGRILAFAYAVIAYVVFLAAFLYAIGFLANAVVPKSIDSGSAEALAAALLVNLGLLAIFAVQHSVMARPAFKRVWTRIVPPAIERSTYVLISSLLLFLLYWQWRPLPGIIWNVENPIGAAVLYALFGLGWLIALSATFMIDHFELFGLKQAFAFLRGREYQPAPFRTPLLYRYVRHPIMLGFIIAFWATPTMTVGRLLFAAVTTAYVLVALQLEERDLVSFHGDDYRAYQRQVSMLVPLPNKQRPQ